MINDAFVNLGGVKMDALVEQVLWRDERRLTLVLPYRPASHAEGLAIYKVKVLAVQGLSDEEVGAFMQHFYAGTAEHEEGFRIWESHNDDSM